MFDNAKGELELVREILRETQTHTFSRSTTRRGTTIRRAQPMLSLLFSPLVRNKRRTAEDDKLFTAISFRNTLLLRRCFLAWNKCVDRRNKGNSEDSKISRSGCKSNKRVPGDESKGVETSDSAKKTSQSSRFDGDPSGPSKYSTPERHRKRKTIYQNEEGQDDTHLSDTNNHQHENGPRTGKGSRKAKTSNSSQNGKLMSNSNKKPPSSPTDLFKAYSASYDAGKLVHGHGQEEFVVSGYKGIRQKVDTGKGKLVSWAGRCGLRNVGNSCYVNAIVQALWNVQVFQDFFLGIPSGSWETSSSQTDRNIDNTDGMT